MFLLQDKTGQINNLTVKYTMELSKLKHLQIYMTIYEPDDNFFECIPQSHHISTAFTSTIEEVFENIETTDIDMTSSHSMIEPIVNRDFGNQFQHQNGTNQHQHIHKNTNKQYEQRKNSQQYQPIFYQRLRTSPIPYLK